MKQVVIYTRVSTDEQAEKGFSLRNQYSVLEIYCRAKQLVILKHFQEDSSAKSFDRPAWNQLLQFVKSNRKEVDAILFTKWDRFSRNIEGALRTIRELKQIGVKVNAIEQPLDLDISDSKLMLSIYLTIPEVENDKNSSRTIDGMRRANAEGCWTGSPPYGYRCFRNEMGKATLAICDEKAYFVRRGFELYAQGCYHSDEVRRMLVNEGMNLSEEQFRSMLKNVAYIGKIRIKAYAKEDEQIVSGLHHPIIDESLFDRVQVVLKKYSKLKRPHQEKVTNAMFVLKGHLVCPICQGHVTASQSKGNGGLYGYYHCLKSACKYRVKAESANNELERHLNQLQPKQEILDLYYEIMKDVFRSDEIQVANQVTALERQIADIDDQIHSIQDKFVKDMISKVDFESIVARYRAKLSDLKIQREYIINRDSNMTRYMKYSFSLLKDFAQYYSSAEYGLKQKLLGSIFPEKLIFQDSLYRTASTDNVFSLLFSDINGFSPSMNKKSREKSRLPLEGSPSRARTSDPMINSHVL